MHPAQKEAWYSLAVVTLTAVTVVGLYPLLGARAMGGFGFLGLLGFNLLFFRRKLGQVMLDERDWLIQQRSQFITYTVFFIAFIFAGWSAVAVYGETGAVPVKVIIAGLWSAVILFYATRSLATLVQYGKGASKQNDPASL